jgi:uncharacterized protein YegP (UPF0339 family)
MTTERLVDSIDIYRSADGWRWRARAGNGEPVASGEAYEHRADAVEIVTRMYPDVTITEVEG